MGLGHVKADYAYGHLSQIKGEDVRAGRRRDHRIHRQRHRPASPRLRGQDDHRVRPARRATDETGHRFSHGTAVASVAAAIRSQHHYSAHGVAWGSRHRHVRHSGRLCGRIDPIRPISLQGLAGQKTRVMGALVQRRAGSLGPRCRNVDILNLSIGLTADHRQLQRAGPARPLRTGDRHHGAGGRRGEDHTCLGRRKRSRRPVLRILRPLRERQDQRGIGRGAAGPRRTDRGAAGPLHRGRGVASGRSDRGLLQPLRHRRRFLHRGARRRNPRGLLRTSRGHRSSGSRLRFQPSAAHPSPRPWSPAGWR